MTTLQACLDQATLYWTTKRNAGIMSMRAQACVDTLGSKRVASSLKVGDAITVLEGLRSRGLSPASQSSYYAAFRRMLALSGIATTDWPSGPTPPRRTREPIPMADLGRLKEELAPHPATLDLAHVLSATGMRVDVEALSFTSWVPRDGPQGKLLAIRGKGGHERVIPVEDELAWSILTDNDRSAAMRKTSYRTHLRNWQGAIQRAGITSKLPTPHAIRHLYATQAYAKCRDIRVVQELLGHSDIATTARYIGADIERMRHALSND